MLLNYNSSVDIQHAISLTIEAFMGVLYEGVAHEADVVASGVEMVGCSV